MGTDISQKRMTETWTGRAACLLLALVWFVSMGVADTHAYSAVPLLAGLALVILLALSAMIRGAKVVQLSKTAWLSLGVGVYFLIRCLCSFSVVESWREAGIILGCGVFYVAGVYAAQGRSPRPIIWTLGVAVLLNLLYFVLMQHTDLPMEWSGRPATGPGGDNHRPVTLFVYKNFAGAFLFVAGALVTMLNLWLRRNPLSLVVWSGVGITAMLVSTQCGTRSIYLLAPLFLFFGLFIWFILKLNIQDRLRTPDIIIGLLFLSVCCTVVGWVSMDPECLQFFSSMKSDGRFYIWGLVCRILPDAPLWGYGSGSVQWITIPRDTQCFSSVNFAHNEYLQVWCDYGLIGLFSMVGILIWHCSRVFYILSEERVSVTQKSMTAAATLCVLVWCGGACVDFFWHHFAIAGMTAYALGIIASPFPRMNDGKGKPCNVLPLGSWGKSILALFCAGSVLLASWLVHQEWPVWSAQWEYNTLAHTDADGQARREMLAKLIPAYPASELMDTYMLLPIGEKVSAKQEMQLLGIALRGNPHQLHIAMRLGARLSEAGQYEEAESHFRRYCPADGLNCNRMADWSMPYVKHLLRWGQHCFYTNEKQKGISLLQYAMKIVDGEHLMQPRRQRFGSMVWMPPGKEEHERWLTYLNARRQELQIAALLKIEPDDSWQAPDAGGKPSLYRRYAAPESLEKADSAAVAPAAVKKE